MEDGKTLGQARSLDISNKAFEHNLKQPPIPKKINLGFNATCTSSINNSK